MFDVQRFSTVLVRQFTVWATGLILCLLALFVQEARAEDPHKRVLVVYSYGSDFVTSPIYSKAIRSSIGSDAEVLEIFLNTKRFDPETMFEIKARSLETKIGFFGQPDLVFTLDDNALIFAERYRDTLFPGKPIVFAGINSVELGRKMAGQADITGSLEVVSIARTLQLAVDLNPTAIKRLIVLHDDTRTSKAVMDAITAALNEFPSIELEPINTATRTFDEVADLVAEVTDPSAIFIRAFATRDKTGRVMSASEMIPMMTRAAKRPFLAITEHGIAAGATAGHVISTNRVVETGTSMANRVLQGEAIAGIPLLTTPPTVSMIDEPLAVNFSLQLEHAPIGTEIRRPIPRFYEQYGREIAAAGIGAGLCFVVSLAIWVSGSRFRRRLISINSALSEKNKALQDAKVLIEHQSMHDRLTGLPNRRALEQFLETTATTDDGIRDLTLFEIDIDDFKSVNDLLGHAAGDSILQDFAKALAGITPDKAFIARNDGDEFTLIHQFNDPAAAIHFGEVLTDILKRKISHNGRVIRISASIGFATMDNEDGCCVEELRRRADFALQMSKKNRRGRSSMFLETYDEEQRVKRQLADDILRGIDEHEFIPYYQGQVCANHGKTISAEVLARWHHPKHGILSPYAFMDIAEEIGAIRAIDAAILNAAANDLKTLNAMGGKLQQISVNVSAARLLDDGLIDTVRSLDFGKTALGFELLEAISLDNADKELDEIIAALRAEGIKIEIDDFGTGRASIIGLRRILPDRVKLARELVAPVLDEKVAQRLIGSIIEMSAALHIGVTAEGVETEEHATILRELGCDVFQGFLYHRPVPFDEFFKALPVNQASNPVLVDAM